MLSLYILLEFLAYTCLFALFIIILVNAFYLCLLFETLQPPSPDDDHDDHDAHDEVIIVDLIDIQTLPIIPSYIPERVPYEIHKIQKIGLIPYQRKKRLKYEFNGAKIYDYFFDPTHVNSSYYYLNRLILTNELNYYLVGLGNLYLLGKI
jgi:hypothetical protein